MRDILYNYKYYLRSVVNCRFFGCLSSINSAILAHSLIIAFDPSVYSAGTVRIKRIFSETSMSLQIVLTVSLINFVFFKKKKNLICQITPKCNNKSLYTYASNFTKIISNCFLIIYRKLFSMFWW
jgi:hypothetical protein